MEGLTIAGIVACIALCSSVCSVAAFWIGRRKAAQDQGEQEGSLKTDLQYIKESVRDTTKSLESLALKLDASDKSREEDYRGLLVQLTELKSSYKSLHIRVDNMEKQIDKYHHHA